MEMVVTVVGHTDTMLSPGSWLSQWWDIQTPYYSGILELCSDVSTRVDISLSSRASLLGSHFILFCEDMLSTLLKQCEEINTPMTNNNPRKN